MMKKEVFRLKDNPEQFHNIFSRAVPVTAEGGVRLEIDEERRSIRSVVATEMPVVVWDWVRWKPVREVLLVDGAEYPKSKQVVLLDTHSRFYSSDIKGSTRNLTIVNDEELGRIITGDVVFAHNAEDEFRLAKDGHLTDTSIGYRVSDENTVRLRPGEKKKIGNREFINEDNKMDLLIRTKWRLFEHSLVPIGADQAAKFRSEFFDRDGIAWKKDAGHEIDPEKLRNLIREEIESRNKKSLLKKEVKKMEEPIISVEQSAEEKEQKRKAEFEAFYRDWKDRVKGVNLEEVKNDMLKLGSSAEEFSEFIKENVVSQYKEAAAKPTVALSRGEVEQYSITRAIASMLNGENCLELEISEEYAKQTGRKIAGSHRAPSFFLPHTVIDHLQKKRFGKRDVNTTASTGGEFVPTEHLGSEWIDVLRNMMVATALGVTYLPGRKGNIEIPKLSSGNVFGWAATENAALSESSPATTEITMTPKRGGTFVDISKQAIIQSDPALDVILTQDGREVMARGFDAGILHGSGSGGQFTGVANVTGVNNTSLASVKWQSLLDAIKTIKAANAALGPLRFCTNAAGEAVLRGRPKETGYPIYLMSDDGRIAGRETVISEQVNAGYLFLGAWNQSYLALWDALDITVDPYTLATTHQVRITFNQLADFAVRYAGAFYYASDLD